MTIIKSLKFDATGLDTPYAAPANGSAIIFSVNFVPDTTSNSPIYINQRLQIHTTSPEHGSVKCKFVLNPGETLSVETTGMTKGTISLIELSSNIISNVIIGNTPTGTKTQTFAQNFREKYFLYSPFALVSNTEFTELFNEMLTAVDLSWFMNGDRLDPATTSLSDITEPINNYPSNLSSFTRLAQIFATYGISPLSIPPTSDSYPLFIINKDAPYYFRLKRWSSYSVEFFPYWPLEYSTAIANNHVFTSIESLLSSNAVNNGQVAFITDVSLFLEQINTPYPTSNIRRYNLSYKTNKRTSLTSNDLYADYESLFV